MAIRLSSRRSEKSTFAKILKLDLISQVSNLKKSDAVDYNPDFKS